MQERKMGVRGGGEGGEENERVKSQVGFLMGGKADQIL